MSLRLILEEQERSTSATGPSAADAVASTLPYTVASTLPSDESGHTAVFPSPLTTAAAIGCGGAVGFAVVYGLVALQANPAFGVAVIVALYAMAMAGLKQLTDARTEMGRAVAVALNALAIGGTLGGLVVLV